MATGQQHKNWGVADFERYHSGKMPEAEMHALEKAALDDPFLEDALEGYAYTKTPAEDVAELRKKLRPQVDDIETPLIWYKRKAVSQLFKVAAIVVIFGGVAWLLFNNTGKDDKTSVAAIAGNEGAPQVSSESAAGLYEVNDSTPIIAKLEDAVPNAGVNEQPAGTLDAPAPNPALKDISHSLPFEKDAMASNHNREVDKRSFAPRPSAIPAKAAAENEVSFNTENKTASAITKKDSLPEQNYFGKGTNSNSQVRGRVIDNTGKPVPFANIRSNAQERQAAAADADGNFVLSNQGSSNNNVQVEVNAAGYEPAQTYLNTNAANQTIVLNRAEDSMSEVVVSGTNERRAKKETYQWNGRNTRIRLRNAEPLEGWDYFYYVMNDSIANNTLLIQLKGSIILQFDTDSSGGVTNVIVKKSLNESADKEAIRLLYKSPVLRVKNSKTKGEATFKSGF